MKIHADRIDEPPSMGLSPARASRILALVPPEWLTYVAEVHISGSLVPSNSRWAPYDAFVRTSTKCLTVFARGRTWQELVTPVLSALAAHHLGIVPGHHNRFSDADSKKLSAATSAYAKRILTQANQPNEA
jgi:hypothetical protein